MFTDAMREELIDGLRKLLMKKLEQIVLYGSAARGESGQESDIDIVLVLSEALEEEEKKRFLHWNAALDLKYGRVFSIIDIEQPLLERWGEVVPFYRNIKNEGVVLWRAA